MKLKGKMSYSAHKCRSCELPSHYWGYWHHYALFRPNSCQQLIWQQFWVHKEQHLWDPCVAGGMQSDKHCPPLHSCEHIWGLWRDWSWCNCWKPWSIATTSHKSLLSHQGWCKNAGDGIWLFIWVAYHHQTRQISVWTKPIPREAHPHIHSFG